MLEVDDHCNDNSSLELRKVFSYCPQCLQQTDFCDKCNMEPQVVLFLKHVVPKINGFSESDDKCISC